MNLLKNQQRAEIIDRIYLDLEDQLMLNIARHLSDWEQTIDTDKWLMRKMAEIGALNKENIRFIAKAALISETAAQRMLEDLAEETLNQLEPGFEHLAKAGYIDETFKPPKSKNMEQVMDTMMDQAKEKMNITNTTMLHKAQEAFRGLASDIARNAMEIMNNNTTAMVTGIKSRQQALERAIKQFAEKGITGFVDQRGRNWTPEAYINMCMRTTAGTTANEIQTARCRDYGINLISIDAHAGARPKCAKDQGKIFDLNNKSGTTEDLNGKKIKYYPWNTSSYGEPDGLLGVNCRHHKYPFIPGVNVQRYFPTDDMDANNRLYKQTQVQRALERDVRKQKRECMMFDELGDKDAYEAAAVKLKAKEAKLKNYVDSHKDLHRREDREQVVGYDKRISSKTSAANKKWKSVGQMANAKSSNDWSKTRPNIITQEDRDELISYAKLSGINIRDLRGFDGDKKLLKEQIDALSNVLDKYPVGNKITITVRDMQDDDFAETINKTIVISQKALRDRNITMNNFSDGYFASKEPKDIVIHEYGHILGKKYGNNGIEIARQALYNINKVDVTAIDTLKYLSDHVSLYSIEPIEKKHRNVYQEIVAEVFVKHMNEPNAFTNEFFNVLLGANK